MTAPEDSVFVGWCDGEQVSHFFADSMLGLYGADHRHPGGPLILDHGGHIAMMSGPRIAAARNDIVRAFLEKSNAGWLLMVDSDMNFAAEDFYKLYEAADKDERPIIGGLYFSGDVKNCAPVMYRLVPTTEEQTNPVEPIEEWPRGQIIKVHATGCGFLLMHRDALVKIGAPYYESPYPWFMEGTIYKGLAFGEDWAFCMRAIEAGYPIHVHTGVSLGHIKPTELDEEWFHAFKKWKDATQKETKKIESDSRLTLSKFMPAQGMNRTERRKAGIR